MSLSCRRVALLLLVVSLVLAASVAVLAAAPSQTHPAPHRAWARLLHAGQRAAHGGWLLHHRGERRSARCLTRALVLAHPCLCVAGTGDGRPRTSQYASWRSMGRVWLYTIAEEGFGPPAGGDLVAVIGPLDVTGGEAYTARYMEAVFPPDWDSACHRASPSRIGSVVRAERNAVSRNAQRSDHGQRRQRCPGPGRLADGNLRRSGPGRDGRWCSSSIAPPSATRCRYTTRPSAVRRFAHWKPKGLCPQ